MKLLFDENLAPGLVPALVALFPESDHVHRLGLASADDVTIWQFARDHAFTIVTKDSDFHERSLMLGYPPKVVWIRRGNCSASEIERILRNHAEDIRSLDTDAEAAFLILV